MAVFTRREFLQATGIGVAAALTVGCEDPREKEMALWRSTSLAERRRKLEFAEFPQVEGFDPLQEMASVVAEVFCKDGSCLPGDLRGKVAFVDEEIFINEYKKEAIRPLAEVDEKRVRERALEFVRRRDGHVFMNIALIRRVVNDLQRKQPELAKQAGGRDLFMVAVESVLFHAFAHTVSTRDVFNIPTIKIIDPIDESKVITLNTMEGTDFVGIRQDGIPFRLPNEGLVEYVGRTKAEENGVYLHLVDRYSDAADLVRSLNVRSGVGFGEFYSHFTGQRQFKDFLNRWGAIKNPPDPNGAVFALMAIAVRGNMMANQQKAAAIIKESLGQDALRHLGE